MLHFPGRPTSFSEVWRAYENCDSSVSEIVPNRERERERERERNREGQTEGQTLHCCFFLQFFHEWALAVCISSNVIIFFVFVTVVTFHNKFPTKYVAMHVL
jgi:hypothetical protein